MSEDDRRGADTRDGELGKPFRFGFGYGVASALYGVSIWKWPTTSLPAKVALSGVLLLLAGAACWAGSVNDKW